MRIRVAARRDAAFEQRKRNLEAAAYLARNWKFESISLQRGVKCEPEDDIVVGGGLTGKDRDSLRRAKATLIYRRTGNLPAVQLLLGHTKIESTVRYLGMEVDDALAMAEQVDA